jgi:tetratricopeptide (TPR) repeat protein
MRAFQRALDRSPKHFLTLNARGVSFAATGDLSLALLDLQNASLAGSLFADAYVNKGYVYIRRHVAAGARSSFGRALQLVPGSGLALAGRGYVQFAESKWSEGKRDLQAAAGGCPCLSSLFAGNMAKAARWAESRALVARAARPGEDVGTTINSVLMRVGQGDRNAVTEVLRLGSENPDYQKKISLTLQSMSNTNPVAKAAIGTAINDFAVRAQDQVDTLQAAKGITVKGQVGAGGSVGVAKLEGQLGVTADLSKSLDQQTKQANQSLDFAKSVQGAVPASKEQLGGVTTSMAAAALDNGDWPIQPHYSLLYPIGAASREERLVSK